MTDVFISYSRKDKDFVKAIHTALAESGREAWVDWQDIPLTADWWQEIERGIEAANTFVFILSSDSVESRVCYQEIEHAVKYHKRLVPLVRRDDFAGDQVHPALKRHNWLFFQETDDFDHAFHKLIETIDTDLEHVKQHTRILVKAIEWNQKDRNPDLLLRGSELELVIQWLTQNVKKEPRSTQIQRDYIGASRKAESDRQEAEIQQQRLQIKRQRMWLGAVAAVSVVAIASAFTAFNQYQQAEQRRVASEKNEVSALIASSEALFSLNKRLDALLQGLNAARLLEQASWIDDNLRTKAVVALQQAVYGVQEYNRLEGHTNRLQSVNFSPDGQLIASASADNTAILWNRNGQLVKRLTGHQNFVYDVKFSPDGKNIATAASDKTVKIWNREGILLKTLQGLSDSDVMFSSDSKTIIIFNKEGLKFYQLDGKLLKAFQPDLFQDYGQNTRVMAYSPDGRTIATVEGKDVKLRMLNSTLEASQIFNHDTGVRDVSFSPDGKTIATAGGDGIVRVWNLTGKKLSQFSATGTSYSELFGIGIRYEWNETAKNLTITEVFENSPAQIARLMVGDRILAVDGKLISEFRFNQSEASDRIRGNVGTEVSLKVERKGGELREVVLRRAKVRFSSPAELMSVRFSPNGQTLATAGADGSVNLWQLNGALVKAFPGHAGFVIGVRFSPDGKSLISAGFDNTIRLWQVNAGESALFDGHTHAINWISFSPDGETFATSGSDKTVKLWNRNGELQKTLEGHNHWVNEANFSSSGQLIASASADKTVKIWNRNGHLLRTLKGHTDMIRAVAFSPDEQSLASVSDDKTIRLWNLDGTLQKVIQGHSDYIYGASFSPDGELLASAGGDRTVKLWTRNGNLYKTLDGHTDVIYDVRFSPDGRLIASASNDTTVKLWNRNGTLLKTLQGHSRGVSNVNFSPNGKLLASSGADGQLILWSLEKPVESRQENAELLEWGTLLSTFGRFNDRIQGLSFSPDGKVLVAVNETKIMMLNLDLQDLLVQGCQWVGDYLKTNSNLKESDRHLCDGVKDERDR
ncbi:TIR domain-containing protein [Leptothermofonsia sp. ETS-13]|uniref:WD40 domain-containing protein n=1 Tax=Leptothermofonsia sp. ETS-13 TaxID=3035696 RepID=UPI003BA3C17F